MACVEPLHCISIRWSRPMHCTWRPLTRTFAALRDTEADLAGGPDGLPDGEVDEHPGKQQGEHQRDPNRAEVRHTAREFQNTPAEKRWEGEVR